LIDDVRGERLLEHVSEWTAWTNDKHIEKEKQDKNCFCVACRSAWNDVEHIRRDLFA
jgi:hypothetical protein